MRQPRLLSYSLSFEHQLPFQSVFTLSYVGTHGINNLHDIDANAPYPNGMPGSSGLCDTVAAPSTPLSGRCFLGARTAANPNGETRPNPNWQGIDYTQAGGTSYYNSFQAQINKRLSKGLQFQVSYTWAKSLDNTRSQTVGDGDPEVILPANLDLSRSYSYFDQRQNLRVNAIYRLPGITSGGIAEKLLGGWWTSTVVAANTGFPFSPTVQANISRSQVGVGSRYSTTDYVNFKPARNNSNVVSGTSAGCPLNGGGAVPAGQELGTPDRYFDVCALSEPLPGFFGNAGRNPLFGPGLANVDFSLVKERPSRLWARVAVCSSALNFSIF
jgi:hypothetical protein